MAHRGEVMNRSRLTPRVMNAYFVERTLYQREW